MSLMKGERGQSMVELALTLPILVFILIGGSDLARAYAFQMAVQNGARAGAEAAAIDFSPSTSLAEGRARDEMGRTPGMDRDVPTVTVSFGQSNGAICLTTPTVVSPCFVTVRIVHTYNAVIPWPLVPNTATFDRQTTMRTIKGP